MRKRVVHRMVNKLDKRKYLRVGFEPFFFFFFWELKVGFELKVMNNSVYIGQAVALNLEITKRILRIGQA